MSRSMLNVGSMRTDSASTTTPRRRWRGRATIPAAPAPASTARRARATTLNELLLVLPRPRARLQRVVELLRRHERGARSRPSRARTWSWHRPSWPFGSRAAWRFGNGVKDFGLFDFDEDSGRAPGRGRRPPTPQETALATFDLALPLTLAGAQGALQGIGEAPSSRRQWRRQSSRGTAQNHQPGLCHPQSQLLSLI